MASEESAGYTTDPAPEEQEQPFSPSVFLNLPPTPPPPSSDDLVLPFISRILMEEETDDDKLLYQHPDSQALLLRAQQPFAEILSGTTTNIVDAAVTNTNTSRPFFPNDVGPSATPDNSMMGRIGRVGLSLTMGDANPNTTTFFAEQDIYNTSVGVGRGQHNTNKAIISMDKTTTPGGAGVLFGGGQMTQIRVTLDMLHQAFLKGMEEANKFLPTNNILLTHSENFAGWPSDEHLSRDHRHRIIAAGQVGSVVDDGIVPPSTLQASGSHSIALKKHNHNWDKLEVEMGSEMVDLRIAVIAPAESDTSIFGGEKTDKFVLIEYQSLLNQMMGMRIDVGTADQATEKNGKKKKKGAKRKSVAVMSNIEPAVDLRSLLMHCACAVATENRLGATELLHKIKQQSSPMGDATQRMAYYYAQGLQARLDGMGSQLYKSLMVKLNSATEFSFLKAYQLYIPMSCFKMMAFKFSNLTILKATTGGRRRKVHIVEYGEHYGFQWPTLLGNWATWEEGEGRPLMVRITCIVPPKSGFRPAARTEETGRRLSDFARRCGIPFKFHSIVAEWETVCANDLNIEPDEVLIVNGIADFWRLMDESIHSIDTPSPRDMVLENIRKMRPDVFILYIENSAYNTPFFLARFREALFYHSAVFDMMDQVAPRDNKDRMFFEQNLLGPHAFNIIACEGWDRVERPETYKQWQARNNRAGLRQLPLDPHIVKAVSNKVRDNYSSDFVISVDKQWFLQGWKGRILYAMSTWVANDGFSSLG